jgi:hypothetical protein
MQRSPDEQRWAEAVTTSHPQVATAEHLAQRFRQVFKDRDSDALKSWLIKSVASGIPELKRFVAGVQRDYEAVVAAVEQHWSNGQVEGQVHRLAKIRECAIAGLRLKWPASDRQPKQLVDKLQLREWVIFAHPFGSPLPNHVDRLDSL